MKCTYLNFLSSEMSFAQLCTMLFVLAIICALLCTIQNGSSSSGSCVQIIGLFVVLFGLRNNFNTIIFGISFERAIYFHKFIGLLFMLGTAFHGYYNLVGSSPSNFASGTMNLTGVILAFLVGGIGLSYLVKNKNFEVFYYLHMAMYIATIPVAFLHGAPIYAFSCVAWAIDLTFRYALRKTSTVAVIDLLPADVIRVTIPKRFDYTAGQYCFLMIPQISFLEFHPFSISTSPFDRSIRFHIRALGDWTNKLKALLEKEAAGSQFNESVTSNYVSDASGMMGMSGPDPISRMVIPIHIEGPYGISSIDLFGAEYEILVLISAGIGITPCQSVFNHLIHQYAINKRKLRKVIFIWSVRDKFMINSVTKSHKKALAVNDSSSVETGNRFTEGGLSGLKQEELPLSFQPNTINFSSKADLTEAAIKAHIEKLKSRRSDLRGSSFVKYKTGENLSDTFLDNGEMNEVRMSEHLENPDIFKESLNNLSFSMGANEKTTENVFHCEFYLTQARQEKADQRAANIFADIQNRYLHFGRPDLPKIFQDVCNLCSHEKCKTYNNNYIDRVAVMTCGPPGIVEDVTNLCKKDHFTSNPDGLSVKVRFDLHAEVFDF